MLYNVGYWSMNQFPSQSHVNYLHRGHALPLQHSTTNTDDTQHTTKSQAAAASHHPSGMMVVNTETLTIAHPSLTVHHGPLPRWGHAMVCCYIVCCVRCCEWCRVWRCCCGGVCLNSTLFHMHYVLMCTYRRTHTHTYIYIYHVHTHTHLFLSSSPPICIDLVYTHIPLVYLAYTHTPPGDYGRYCLPIWGCHLAYTTHTTPPCSRYTCSSYTPHNTDTPHNTHHHIAPHYIAPHHLILYIT